MAEHDREGCVAYYYFISLLTVLCDILYYTQHMAEHDREGWQRTIENITATPGSTSAVGTLFFAPITR